MTYLPLIATVAALLCGPLLYAVARYRPPVLAFLDGFVLVSIAGLVLLEVLPGTFAEGGAWSLAFLVAGAIGPSIVERALHEARREAHLATLALAVLGLVLHSVADGAALSSDPAHHGADHHGAEALALAVVVHSVPVGLVVWWIMAPVFGAMWPSLTIAAMCLGTAAGFLFGIELNALLGAQAFAWFQALVAGSILHVVFGRPHLHDQEAQHVHSHPPPPFEGLGNLVALLGLGLIASLDPHEGLIDGFAGRMAELMLRCSPWILFAYGAVAVLLSGGFLVRLRATDGKERSRFGLRRQSSGAQTVVVGLLGLGLTIPLLGTAFGLAWWTSAILLHFARERIAPESTAGGASEIEPVPVFAGASPPRPNLIGAMLGALIDATVPWLVAGLVLAALLEPHLSMLSFSRWPAAIDVPVLAALAIPLYAGALCALPVLGAAVSAGLSPGAALAFLIAGPYLKLGYLRAQRREQGAARALALAVLTGVAATVAGVLADWLVLDRAGVEPLASRLPDALEYSSALVVLLLILISLLRSGGRGWLSRLAPLQPSTEHLA